MKLSVRSIANTPASTTASNARVFAIDRTLTFTFYTYGDSAEELREYVEGNWRNATIDAETMRRTREVLRADPQARPRVREHVQLTTLRVPT